MRYKSLDTRAMFLACSNYTIAKIEWENYRYTRMRTKKKITRFKIKKLVSAMILLYNGLSHFV